MKCYDCLPGAAISVFRCACLCVLCVHACMLECVHVFTRQHACVCLYVYQFASSPTFSSQQNTPLSVEPIK